MRKLLLFSFNLILLLLISISLITAISTYKLTQTARQKWGYSNLDAFLQHCDHIYQQQNILSSDTGVYVNIVSNELRNKFVHGYSYYDYKTNFFAAIISKTFHTDYNAIVLPADILKYPKAACSQVAIVAIAALRKKGIRTAPVKFRNTPGVSGHFAYSVFYADKWHYYDDNLKPDFDAIGKEHYSFHHLMADTALLSSIYKGKADENFILNMPKNVSFGKLQEKIAVNATFFQRFTLFLSYASWIILLGIRFLFQKLNIFPFSSRQK